MSDSDWRQFIKDRGGLIVAGLFALVAIIIIIQLARVWEWEIDYDASRNAANYATDAKNDISAKCLGLTAQARDDCEDKINDAARSNQRDEYDLAAQQTMALWTAIMGGMSVLGVGLSGLGIYLIWQTWIDTRKSAESSQDTLKAFMTKERARVFHKEMTFAMSALPPDEGRWEAHLSFGIENIGDTSAHKIKTIATCYLYKRRLQVSDMRRVGYVGVIGAGEAQPVTLVLKVRAGDVEFIAARKPQRVIVHIQTSYSDIFERRHTEDFWLDAVTRKSVDRDHFTTDFESIVPDYVANTSHAREPKRGRKKRREGRASDDSRQRQGG